MSYEKLIIEGNLGKDPVLRHLEDGTAVTTISVAVNKKRNGSKATTPHTNIADTSRHKFTGT